MSTRFRCAPIRSQLRLLRLLAPASLTAGASAAASARSQIILQDGSARNLLLSPTALSTIKCALACPHPHCRASRLAMGKRVYAGCCVPRLNRLPSVASRPCAPTGCTLPMSRPTCRRPPRGTSRFPPTSATCASRPRCPPCSRRCRCRHELSTHGGWRTTMVAACACALAASVRTTAAACDGDEACVCCPVGAVQPVRCCLRRLLRRPAVDSSAFANLSTAGSGVISCVPLYRPLLACAR